MAWKYVVLRLQGETIDYEFPVIFPDKLVHADVARMLRQSMITDFKKKPEQVTVVSAGMIGAIDVLGLGGHSTTLGIGSRVRDRNLIEMLHINHGISDPSGVEEDEEEDEVDNPTAIQKTKPTMTDFERKQLMDSGMDTLLVVAGLEPINGTRSLDSVAGSPLAITEDSVHNLSKLFGIDKEEDEGDLSTVDAYIKAYASRDFAPTIDGKAENSVIHEPMRSRRKRYPVLPPRKEKQQLDRRG